jgi:hypothetical protein
MARDYAEKHGVGLNTATCGDLGVSAFRRKNVEHSALATFTGAIKSGKVLRGSYLLTEQFDRISRAEITIALELPLCLMQASIAGCTSQGRPQRLGRHTSGSGGRRQGWSHHGIRHQFPPGFDFSAS